MLSGHGESFRTRILVSVMHGRSGVAVYCSAIDEWLSVCAAVALAKALCGFACSLYSQLKCFLQAHDALPNVASGVVTQQLCSLTHENKMCNRWRSIIACNPFLC